MSLDHSSSSSFSSSSTIDLDHSSTFTSIPNDIVGNHILTRLDGPTLASVSCMSTRLHSLCLNEDLWRNICHDTWPSTKDPLVRNAINHRSLFSHSFSSLQHGKINTHRHHVCDCLVTTDQLISAVDMHYKGRLVYSKVQVTNKLTEAYLCKPTWVDMMDARDNDVTATTRFGIASDELLSLVTENLTLSWIIIDPKRKLATNVSSLQPVSIEPHFLNGHVSMRYSTILTSTSMCSEKAEIRIAVTCEVKEREEVEVKVKEMRLVMLDKYGEVMKWRDSLVILQEDMEGGRRGNGEEKERYEEYLKSVGERKREKVMGEMKGYQIAGVICMLLYSIPILLWVLCYCFNRLCNFFNRYILRKRER